MPLQGTHTYILYMQQEQQVFLYTGEEISKLELIKISTHLDVLFAYMKTSPVCMTASELVLLKGPVINCSIDKIQNIKNAKYKTGKIEIRVQFINK